MERSPTSPSAGHGVPAEPVQTPLQRVVDPVLRARGVLHFNSSPGFERKGELIKDCPWWLWRSLVTDPPQVARGGCRAVPLLPHLVKDSSTCPCGNRGKHRGDVSPALQDIVKLRQLCHIPPLLQGAAGTLAGRARRISSHPIHIHGAGRAGTGTPFPGTLLSGSVSNHR